MTGELVNMLCKKWNAKIITDYEKLRGILENFGLRQYEDYYISWKNKYK